MGIEASLELLNGSCAEQERKRKALELALERARYQVEHARGQYDAVDPTNRLVVAELESRWNAALVQVSEAEARLQAEQQALVPLDERQRQRLLTLGSDLQALWEDAAAPVELKKRILRTVIHEIVTDVNHTGTATTVAWPRWCLARRPGSAPRVISTLAGRPGPESAICICWPTTCVS